MFAGGVIAVIGSVLIAKPWQKAPQPPPAQPAAEVGVQRPIGERVAVNEANIASITAAVEDVEDAAELSDRRVAHLEHWRESTVDPELRRVRERLTQLEARYGLPDGGDGPP